jgi:hypothetical protein
MAPHVKQEEAKDIVDCFDAFWKEVSVPQNLRELNADHRPCLDQILCVIFDALSHISPTSINEIKHLSIQSDVQFLEFSLPADNTLRPHVKAW